VITVISVLHIVSLVFYILSFISFWRFFVSKRSSTGIRATYALVAALGIHTLMLILFTVNRGYLPLGQFAQAATSFVWLLGILYLIQQILLKEREFGVFVTSILAIVQAITVLVIDYQKPLAEVLQNVLFEIHVSFILIAYAGFALAFIAGIMYLLLFAEIQRHRFGLFYSRLPSLEFLDKLNIRSVLTGFAFLTCGIGIGMINANKAWGFFWEWDPKLTVVFLNWLIYLYFTVSYQWFDWRGQRTAWLSVLGFVVVIVSFFIVTNFASTIHTF